MLRNRYFIAALGGLLVLVVIYNVSFFSQRTKGAVGSAPAPAAAAKLPPEPAPTVAARDHVVDWRRDPFWYASAKKDSRPTGEKQRAGLRLEATMGKDGKAFAIINGAVVGIGEKLNGYVVSEIGDQFVKLKGPAGARTLTLASDSNEKE